VALCSLAALDPTLISGAQVCDGPLTPPLDLIEEASNARGVPGSRAVPIARISRAWNLNDCAELLFETWPIDLVKKIYR